MIGIDIGRVIISGDTDIPNLFFSDKYLNVPPVNDAFESIQLLTKKFKPENVYLVSKCSEKTQERTLTWLELNNFFVQTKFLKKIYGFVEKELIKKEFVKILE